MCEETAQKAFEIDSVNTGSGIFPNVFENIALSNIYLENKEKAEVFLNKFYDYMHKSNDKNLHNSISDMEVKYETEKKEIRIVSLEKERQLYVWLGIAGGMLLISLLFVLMQNKRNSRKEKQIIAARAVQDGEIGERARIAEDLHDRIGGSLSDVKIGLKNIRDRVASCNGKLDITTSPGKGTETIIELKIEN